jgi:hypothetical protein
MSVKLTRRTGAAGAKDFAVNEEKLIRRGRTGEI